MTRENIKFAAYLIGFLLAFPFAYLLINFVIPFMNSFLNLLQKNQNEAFFVFLFSLALIMLVVRGVIYIVHKSYNKFKEQDAEELEIWDN